MELEINREDLIDDDIAREILPTSEEYTIFAAPAESRLDALGVGDTIIYGHQKHLIEKVEPHQVANRDYKQYFCVTLPD